MRNLLLVCLSDNGFMPKTHEAAGSSRSPTGRCRPNPAERARTGSTRAASSSGSTRHTRRAVRYVEHCSDLPHRMVENRCVFDPPHRMVGIKL